MDEKVNNPESATDSDKGTYKRSNKGGNWVGAVILISVGAVLLLQNFNLLPDNIWSTLWRFWPLILILIGLQIILGKSRTSSLILAVLSLILIGGLVLIASAKEDKRVEAWFKDRIGIDLRIGDLPLSSLIGSEKQANLGVEKEKTLNSSFRDIKIDISTGKLTLNTEDSDNPFNLEAIHPEGIGIPDLKSDLENGVLTINLNTRNEGSFLNTNFGRMEYNAKIGKPELETALDINVSTGKAEVDLEQLNLKNINLRVSTGAADVSLNKEALPKERSRLKVSTGSLEVRIPESVGLQIKYDVGVGRLKVDESNISGDGTYTSQNYESAAKKVILDAEVGTGSLRINRY